MLIPLGFLAAGGGGGAFDLLESQVLSSSASSVTFSSLSAYASTYQHLQIRAVWRGARAEADDDLLMRFNSDTGTNYSYHRVGTFNASSVVSAATTSADKMFVSTGSGNSSTANAFTGVVIDILDPFEITKFKTVRSLGGVASSINYLQLISSSWRNTAAVNSIQLYNYSNTAALSRFSLYGIKGS